MGKCSDALPIDSFYTVGNVDLLDSTNQWIETGDTTLNFTDKKGNEASMHVSTLYTGTRYSSGPQHDGKLAATRR